MNRGRVIRGRVFILTILTTQTHTIRRGALGFATQISPLLNYNLSFGNNRLFVQYSSRANNWIMIFFHYLNIGQKKLKNDTWRMNLRVICFFIFHILTFFCSTYSQTNKICVLWHCVSLRRFWTSVYQVLNRFFNKIHTCKFQ